MIEISRDMPLSDMKTRPSKYPYRRMQVGESFFVARDSVNQTIWSRSTSFAFRTHRTVENGVRGVRIFRVA
jgi:hypothetical protein